MCSYRFCLDNQSSLNRDQGFARLQSRLIRYETQTTCSKEPFALPFALSPAPSPAVMSEPGSVPDGETLQNSDVTQLKRKSREMDIVGSYPRKRYHDLFSCCSAGCELMKTIIKNPWCETSFYICLIKVGEVREQRLPVFSEQQQQRHTFRLQVSTTAANQIQVHLSLYWHIFCCRTNIRWKVNVAIQYKPCDVIMALLFRSPIWAGFTFSTREWIKPPIGGPSAVTLCCLLSIRVSWSALWPHETRIEMTVVLTQQTAASSHPFTEL